MTPFIVSGIFYGFSLLLIVAATMVISAKNPMRGVLSLVVAFFAASGLWMLLQMEFLALILVLVYVGAVMTLFLFVIMMLNIHTSSQKSAFVKYFPIGIFLVAMIVLIMVKVLAPIHLTLDGAAVVFPDHSTNNVKDLGRVLYTDYLYAFELAGILLLASIVAAIGITFRGKRGGKGANIDEQIRVDKSDRLRIVKVESGGKYTDLQ